MTLALLIAAALLGPGAAAAKPDHGDKGRESHGGGSKERDSKGHDSTGSDDRREGSGNGHAGSRNEQPETRDEGRGSGDQPGASGDQPAASGNEPRRDGESRSDSGKDKGRGDRGPGDGGRGDRGPSHGQGRGRNDDGRADPAPVTAAQPAAPPPAIAPAPPTSAPPVTPTATPAVTPNAAAPKPPKREPNRLFRAFAATEPASFLAATLEGDPMDAPPLKPFLELEQQQATPTGRPAAAEIDRRAAADPRKEPSLPFSGFSLLALVLSGMAAITSGRRLHELSAEPAPAQPKTEPMLPEPLPAAPLPAHRHRPPRTQRPHRTTIAIGAAAFAVTALAVARAR